MIKVSKRWNGYYMTVINFLFKKLPNCFPECIFTISRSILGMISLLSISHSNRPICIVILTCISQMTNDIKHLLKSLFCSIFFAEVICSTILPGASVRNSAHGKGHEEVGLAYTKAWSSLRKPPVPEHLTPKPESVLWSHLHLWLYEGLSPITVSLGGVNVQLQGNKNSWAWQECFSLWTPLKVI